MTGPLARAGANAHPQPCCWVYIVFKATAAPRSFPGAGCPRCAGTARRMNGGGVEGGALAADDAGKPGAPEDTARVGVGPEVEGEGQRAPPLALVEGGHVTALTAPTRVHPLPTAALLAGPQLRRHLLAGARGLCRHHRLWGGGGSGISRSPTVTTAPIRVIITPDVQHILEFSAQLRQRGLSTVTEALYPPPPTRS